MSRRVVGLDLSLTSTGVAIVTVGSAAASATTERILSTGKADATLAQRRDRLKAIVTEVREYARHADLVVLEGPSYGSKGGSQHDRSGLWWSVVDWALHVGLPVAEVSPSSRMMYGTGRGRAEKDEVLAATVRRYPTVEFSGNDEGDALLLAAMGARHLGHPIEPTLPLTHLRAMDSIAWPDPL